ncbi:unnamed protein product [Symbiodinium necroappetens]|uniref:Uncharacterized protein n=1 Tax=Symbiodinium necroappetens TaxID=1628268 RepID=A0A812MGB0_9DINO|nr:unnamed protein product [Symbiodinium necroappetens]
MELLFGAAAAGGGGLFSYNRENYMFDKELLIKRDYQAQKMRVEQSKLYREDVRDLVNLTVRKMDNYLIVSTLQLGFAMTLYVEGRPEKDVGPTWLIHLFAICNAGAFLYYLLSIWLALHASVAAHAFGVRLLTQFVRLPIPDDATLDKSRFQAQQYEGSTAREMFRVPLLRQQLKRLNHAMEQTDEDEVISGGVSMSGSEEDLDPSISPVMLLEHVQLYRRTQANWQSFDAYARVCMSMGTNQLLYTLSYMMLGTLVAVNDVPLPALSCVVIFTGCAWILARLDLYLSRKILAVAAVLLILPPTLVTVSFSLHRVWANEPTSFMIGCYRVMVPLAFFLHLTWILFTWIVARGVKFGSVELPTNYRSVLFLDVFGFLAAQADQDARGDEPPEESEMQRQLSVVREESPRVDGTEGEALPAEVLQMLMPECHQLQTQLSADLRRFELPQVLGLLRQEPGAASMLRQLRQEFDSFASDVACLEVSQDAASSRPPQESQPVWLRLDWFSNGRPMQVFHNAEEGTTVWEEPSGSARIIDMYSLRTDLERFGEHVGLLRRHCRRHDGSPTNDVENAAGNITLTFHPSFAPTEDAPDAESAQAAEEEDRRRDEHYRLRPGRLPAQTVKIGTMVLVGAWATSVVWIIIYITSEARHLRVTGTIEQALAATAASAWMKLFLHEPTLHKASFRLPFAEVVSFEQWPQAFSKPTALACNPDLGDVLMVVERYRAAVLPLREDAELIKQAATLQARLDRCLSDAPPLKAFQAQGIRSASIQCDRTSEAATDCTVWLLSARGSQVLRCPMTGPGLAKISRVLGGPFRSLGAFRGPWALRTSNTTFEEPTEDVVQLQPHCDHETCDLIPRRSYDVAERGDGLVMWPTQRSWMFTFAAREEALRGFRLNADEGAVKFIDLQLPRFSAGDRWLGGCVMSNTLYFLYMESLGQRSTPSFISLSFAAVQRDVLKNDLLIASPAACRFRRPMMPPYLPPVPGPPPPKPERRSEELCLEDFLGDWHDTMGNKVSVEWARNTSRGQLDVALSKRGNGRFSCGHYQLEDKTSSPYKIVWVDNRHKGKQSIWDLCTSRASQVLYHVQLGQAKLVAGQRVILGPASPASLL